MLASPISNVLEVALTATFFCKFPTTYPLVLETAPADVSITLFEPEVILPEVKVSVPPIVKSDPKVIPPAPFKVILLHVPVNVLAGIVNALVLVNATVALALLASIFPVYVVPSLLMVEPLSVNVLAPTVKVPLVRERLLVIVELLLRVTLAFMIKLDGLPSVAE